MKTLLSIIIAACISFTLFVTNANAQLLIDDFTTGNLEKITFSDGSTQKHLQSGSNIIKGVDQPIGHRQVFSRLSQNPYSHNAQINILNNLLVMSFGYNTSGTVYVNYGVDKNGNAAMNLNVKKYNSIKVKFDAKSTVNGINLYLFTGTSSANYGRHVEAREGDIVVTIPFSKIKAKVTGSNFSFSDIDYIWFQFDSRSKTGCNMAIDKIWFE